MTESLSAIQTELTPTSTRTLPDLESVPEYVPKFVPALQTGSEFEPESEWWVNSNPYPNPNLLTSNWIWRRTRPGTPPPTGLESSPKSVASHFKLHLTPNSQPQLILNPYPNRYPHFWTKSKIEPEVEPEIEPKIENLIRSLYYLTYKRTVFSGLFNESREKDEKYFALDLGDEDYDSVLEIGGYSGEWPLHVEGKISPSLHSLLL